VGEADLLAVCNLVADEIALAIGSVEGWGRPGERPGQYAVDLVADAAGVAVLLDAGMGVLSEESGLHEGQRELLAVLDPLDGSSNAAHGLPWYATSVCVLDDLGPRAAVVANQATGVRYDAIRGGGARRGDRPLSASGCVSLPQAIVALSGYPARHLGWNQYRCLGAAALDLCAVAEGALDAYAVVGNSSLGSWDYMGGMLVCTEAGAVVVEAGGLDLLTVDHDARRCPLAAATPELLDELRAGVEAARRA
jgi:fructose-1,6-bisphosphatase/inositol monophosphatase family enzyme